MIPPAVLQRCIAATLHSDFRDDAPVGFDAVDQDQWSTTTCSEIMIHDLTPARLSWTVREASELMENADVDIIPVVDTAGRVVGVVTDQSIVNVVELLDETQGE